MSTGSVTIRVYGICINEGKLLVADEFIHKQHVTKLPGGGLEFGEGTIDCLIRELKEESGERIQVLDHFYTTDFFQVSIFDPSKQVMSIYYTFHFLDKTKFRVKEKPFDYDELIDDAIAFRWIDLKQLKKEDFTLPIDQLVAEKIIDLHRKK